MEDRPVTRRMTRSSRIQPQQLPPADQRVVKRVEKTPSFTDTFKGRLAWKIRHCDYPMTSTPILSETEKQPKTVVGHIQKFVVKNSITKPNDVSILSPILKPDMLSRLFMNDQSSANVNNVKPRHPLQPNEPIQVPSIARVPHIVSEVKEGAIPHQESLAPVLNFNQLLYRYADDVDDDKKENQTQLHVHFEPHKAKTYSAKSAQGSKKDGDHLPKRNSSETKISTEPKPKKSKRAVKGSKKDETSKITKSKTKGPKVKLDPETVDWIKKTNREFEDVMSFDLCVEKC